MCLWSLKTLIQKKRNNHQLTIFSVCMFDCSWRQKGWLKILIVLHWILFSFLFLSLTTPQNAPVCMVPLAIFLKVKTCENCEQYYPSLNKANLSQKDLLSTEWEDWMWCISHCFWFHIYKYLSVPFWCLLLFTNIVIVITVLFFLINREKHF